MTQPDITWHIISVSDIQSCSHFSDELVCIYLTVFFIYRGHNQNTPMEEAPPTQNSLIPPTVPEDVAILSGEYCEIESPGIPEEDENDFYAEHTSIRSPIGLVSTPLGWLCTKTQCYT